MADSSLLKDAIEAARQGEQVRALELLARVLQIDPGNETAWLWMSSVVQTDEARSFCLRSALAVNSNNTAAKAGLALLEEQTRPVRSRLDLWTQAASQVRPLPAPWLNRHQLEGALLMGLGLVALLIAVGLFVARPPARLAANWTVRALPTGTPLPLPSANIQATASPTPLPTPTPAPIPPPGRLSIPDLNLDEPIAIVPLRQGKWDISELEEQVGWLDATGRMPGDDIAMTFIGHVTVSAFRNGPFAGLRTLRPGAEIIYNWNGVNYVYAVDDVTVVSPQEVDQLFVHDGRMLLLVTCSSWSYVAQNYAKRSITRAVLVKEEPAS